MLLRDGLGYRERHGKGTLIPCFLLMIILSLSIYYIVDYGTHSRPSENPTVYAMHYELYSETNNVSGVITIYDSLNNTVEVMNVEDDGSVLSGASYILGTYYLYYVGNENGINFGSVEFQIQKQDSLLVDRIIAGEIRLTIMVL